MDGGKTKSLSDYSIGKSRFGANNRNRQAVANIVGYYAKQIGVEGVGATHESGGMAHYNSNNDVIWIAPTGENGIVSSSLNDKNNLMNILVHEQQHRVDNVNGVQSSFESHANVYISQMGDESFSKTTDGFQSGTINNMMEYVLGVKDRSTQRKLINSFNNTNKGGYRMDESHTSGSGWGLSKGGVKKYINPEKAKSAN